MQIVKTEIEGVVVVELDRIGDDRGFFARSFCKKEFDEAGLPSTLVQCNVSFNVEAGTLRGLHYQIEPARENKLVRCTQGSIVDVAVDLRPDSPTYLQHVMTKLTAENRRMMFVPEHFAHGFQTLEPNTEVTYQVSEYYTPEAERGARYDDPSLGINWPLEVTNISPKDSDWPPLQRG